jgi:uncharacterized protein YggE
MKTKILTFFVVLVAAVLLVACGSPTQPQNIRMINVVGSGTVYLAPDVVYINIGVRSQAEGVRDALTQNSTQAAAIVSALKGLGVEEKYIQTSAFNVYPQQQFGPNGEVTNTVYIVENTVYVTVKDLSKLGQILDSVVQSGANTINGIQFDVLDKSIALTEARKIAVEEARKQAEELASAAGVKLGALQSINVYMTTGPVPAFSGKGGARLDTLQTNVPVSAGQLVLTMEANLSYEIK